MIFYLFFMVLSGFFPFLIVLGCSWWFLAVLSVFVVVFCGSW